MGISTGEVGDWSRVKDVFFCTGRHVYVMLL